MPARRGSTRVLNARVPAVRPSAGSSQAAAATSSGSKAAPAAVSARVVRTTASDRSSSSRVEEYGDATVTSYVGSTAGPNDAATPATGNTGASARNSAT